MVIFVLDRADCEGHFFVKVCIGTLMRIPFLDQKQHQPVAGFHPEPVNHHDESAMCSFRTAGTPAKPSSVAVAAPNTPIQDDLALSDTATADSCWGSATFNPVSVFSVLIQKEYRLNSTT